MKASELIKALQKACRLRNQLEMAAEVELKITPKRSI